MRNEENNESGKNRAKTDEETASSRLKKNPRDLGDPRGSRAPDDKIRRTDVTEKGDAKRKPKK